MNSDSKNEFASLQTSEAGSSALLTPAAVTWIDLKTAAELKGITARALRLALNKGKYTTRETFAQGGKTSEILLSSLEAEIQEKYKERFYQEIVELEAQIIPLSKPVIKKK